MNRYVFESGGINLDLQFGFFSEDITPQEPVLQAGYASRSEVSKGIHDPLFVKSLYLKKGSNELVISTFDLIALDHDIVQSIKRKVVAKTNIKNIILNVTHTHSGPHTTEFLYGAKINKKWKKNLINKAVYSIIMSKKNLQKAKIGIQKDRLNNIAYNRRNLKEIVDAELNIIEITDDKNNPKVIIINFPCHATVLGADNLYISADYPAYLYKKIKERFQEVEIFFWNGSAGDINIGYSADSSALGEKVNNRNYDYAEKIGKKIANKSLSLLDKIKLNREISLDFKEINFLQKTKVLSLEDLKKRINENKTNSKNNRESKIKLIYNKALFRKLEYLKNNNLFVNNKKEIIIKTAVLNINDYVFLFIPGELFYPIKEKLKEKLQNNCNKKLILTCYYDGYIGYLPTKKAFEDEGYEIYTSIVNQDFENNFIKIMNNQICK